MSVNLVCLNSFLFVVDNLLELRAMETLFYYGSKNFWMPRYPIQ